MITAKQILESIPARFRPEKARDKKLTFHFDIGGDEALQYTVLISEGRCELKQGLIGDADCVIKTKASTYVDLETGKTNPQTAFMLGKIKVSNISAMMEFAKCFRKFDADEGGAKAAVVRPKKAGPLAGVRIIDFTRLLPGPMATMFLADLGADVIKVEDPDNPDYIRGFEPRVNGVSMLYLALNRGKRSLAINYLNEEGRKVIHDLVKTADVLVEQFRPGVMRDIGLGYEELSKINPRLIYISITGYGQNSSRAMDAGHDLNYIAIAGSLGITGTKEEVTIPGFQLGDIAGGSYSAMNAVTAALYQREKTGKGDWVDVAMTDASVPFTALQFASYQAEKKEPGRANYELSGRLANYNVYQCGDGKYLALGSLEPKFWNRFCAKVDKPEWSSAFMLHGDESEAMKAQVRAFFKQKPRAEWLEFFKDEDFCLTTVNDLSDLADDPYLKERNMFVQQQDPAAGEYLTINQPLKFRESLKNGWSAPQLGEDSAEILRELGRAPQ